MKVSRKHLLIAAVVAGTGVLWFQADRSRHSEGRNALSPETATSQANRIPSDNLQQSSAVAGEVDSWKTEFIARLAELSGDDFSPERTAAFRAAVARLPLDRIPAALSLVSKGFTDSQRRLADMVLLERWAAATPALAASWVDRNLEGNERNDTLLRVAQIWAEDDAAAAWDWARQLSDSSDRATAIGGAAFEIARENPSLTFEIADQLPDTIATEVLSKAAAAWTEISPQEALEAATSLESKSLQEEVVASVAVAWAQSDPRAAGNLAVQTLPPGRAQDDAVIGVIQRWAQADPATAASWVSTFAPGELGDTASENLVKLWPDRDSDALDKWISNLPTGERRDIALAAYGEKLATSAPQTAAAWISSIGDETLREERMRHLAEVWFGANPGTAGKR